ncbi:hypothetical protein B0H17DRAFT_1327751 [Mycena rosella]|uniref:DUF6534 domain-containing protein n=1 Tax=Mycena rosella TaxID=1033263 RepID=A0AAD7DW97_MYCRO|nr:hypothetical protein B0H17DRAFT_1327751 [Mycena rosella]
MGILDLTIGCLLFASWGNMILFTLQGIETYRYFTKYPRDIWFNKGSVLVALASDFMTVFACLSSVYLYTVTHWGSETYVQSQPWCLPVYIIGTGVTATVVQVWLTRMVWNLTRQWFWIPIIGIFILVGITGAGATAGQIFLDSSYSARVNLIKYVTTWLTGCAAADALITGVLVWKFRSIKTSFTDTKDLLRRLSIAAVRNGSITTAMTLITIIVFKIQPQTNTATMIEARTSLSRLDFTNNFAQMIIGRVYTISMLSNLNNRTLMMDEAQSSNGPKRTGQGDTPTILRIRQDVETHYQSDVDVIPMQSIGYGGKADLESGDGRSDRDVNLVVHVEGKQL